MLVFFNATLTLKPKDNECQTQFAQCPVFLTAEPCAEATHGNSDGHNGCVGIARVWDDVSSPLLSPVATSMALNPFP